MAKKREAAAVKKVKAPGEPVYTVMAFITFVAIALGCTLLYLDFDTYGKNPPPKEPNLTLPKLGDLPKAGPATGAGAGADGGAAPMPMPMPGM